MPSRRILLVLSGIVAVGLIGCTPQAEPDWRAEESAAHEFESAASTREGFLGSGSIRVDPGESSQSEDSDVTLSYALDVRIDGMTAACFGGGTARAGVTVRVGSSWTGTEPVDVECDGVENAVEFDEPIDRVNAVRINGMQADGAGSVLVVVLRGWGHRASSLRSPAFRATADRLTASLR